jgi:predicted DNA-binding transcriptional regulator AlpA
MSASPYLRVPDVAARYGQSIDWVWTRTAQRAIPFRKLPRSRACLFLEDELRAWDEGAPLEVVDQPNGGVRVVPR